MISFEAALVQEAEKGQSRVMGRLRISYSEAICGWKMGQLRRA
jgi:hypothetical protein